MKRDYLEYLKNNCNSIGAGNTLLPVFIKYVKPPPPGSSKRTPYSLICVAMNNKPTLVRYAIKKDDNKKQRTDEEESNETQNYGEGSTVNKGDLIFVSSFDQANASKLNGGDFIELACSASVYNDNYGNTRITYKNDRLLIKKDMSALTKNIYDRYISDSPLSVIPTIHDINPKDFKEGTPENKMVRQFVAPMSNDQSNFEDIIIVLENDENNMVCKKTDNEVTQDYVGFSTSEGGKSSNSIGIVYRPYPKEDGTKEKDIMLKLSFFPNFWLVFGIGDVDLWKPVAKRIVSNLKNSYFYAYSSLESIKNLKCIAKDDNYYDENGMEDDDNDKDEDEIVSTCAFGTKLNVDLNATVKNCGILINQDYIEAILGSESGHEYNKEYKPYGADEDNLPKHPLNNTFRNKLERGVPSVFNLSEFHTDDIDKFFKAANKFCPNKIQYYGIFADDRPYEHDAERQGDLTEYIKDNGIKPNIVYAILE